MRKLPFAALLSAIMLGVVFTAAAAEGISETEAYEHKVVLPKPDVTGGMPLMQALSLRQSNRKIDLNRQLDNKVLGDLLWATWGVNRADGRRTAPTAKNTQNVGVCVAMANGVWWYNGPNHELELALNKDIRDRNAGVPVTLIFFAPADDPAAGLHVGSLYQNAGLYCASAGLANVVKTSIVDQYSDLDLPAGYKVLAVQSVGYPQ